MKIAFIGCGNMAKAMINGLAKETKYELLGIDHHPENLIKLHETAGLKPYDDAKEMVKHADLTVLSIKPKDYEKTILEIRDFVDDGIIMSIAPGWSLDSLESVFGKKVKLVRVMPNTPALVGEGMSAYKTRGLSEAEKNSVVEILESFGKSIEVDEYLFPAITAASGSSPAYIFMLIEALADAAVAEGMKRKDAYYVVSQAVLGSAKMVLKSKKHPAELKDQVTSPAGTTIEAVAVLEKMGFRSALIEAFRACARKS